MNPSDFILLINLCCLLIFLTDGTNINPTPNKISTKPGKAKNEATKAPKHNSTMPADLQIVLIISILSTSYHCLGLKIKLSVAVLPPFPPSPSSTSKNVLSL